MSVELYRDPNKYAPRAFIEIKRGSIIFHGYQNYSLTRNTVRVSSRDVKLAAKQRLVRKFFTTKFLSNKTLLDIGANAAFFCFWALQNGAKKATALDIDEDYVKMVNSAKEKLEFKDITVKESSITDWTEQADLVTAFALVHWLYSCTADYGSLDAVIKKLSGLTRAVLIVEWIDPKDKAIRFFRHTDYNQAIINSPYDRIAFEDALARHFEDFRVLGSVTPTRIVYAAYKFASRVEITEDLPLLFDKENVVSSRRLTTHSRKKYFSRVYIEENSPFAFKQATGDLAEREGLILSKLDSRYFPRVCDIRKENGYSVVKLENISAIRLYKAIPGISSSFESLGVFCRHCLNILGELNKKGIIHRDIRAENIFIRDDGSPVLMDFGWAIAGGYPCITPRGLEEGEGCPPDKKCCDVYAMGIIFKRVNRGIYPQLKPLIYAMTQKDGSKRITNIPALMEMLDRILSGGTGEDLTGDAKSFIEKHGLASIIEMLESDNILELPDGLMFKKFECNVFMDFLKEKFLRNRARHLYNISRRFYEKGLPVPGPITYIGPSFGSKRSFYLSYAVNNSDDLENVYKNEMLGDYGDIAAQLGKTLAGWHLAGAVHGNLRWSNILLKKEGGGLRFFLLNLDKARLHGKPDVKGMIKDIVRFYRYAMEIGAEEWVDKEFLPNYFASLAGDVRGKINPEVIRKMASRDRKDKR